MSWILYSALMFLSTASSYLLIRKLQKENIDGRLITLAFGALPAPLLGLYILVSGIPIHLTTTQIAILAFNGIILSFFGQKFSVMAMKSSPNPGYSLIIQKSYAPYAAILAYFLFGSELKVTALISILIIIIFAYQITVEPIKNMHISNSYLWIGQSLIPFFAFGNLVISVKYLLNQGMNIFVINFICFGFAALMFSFDNRKIITARKPMRLSLTVFITLVLIGTTNALFNIFMHSAFKGAPNVGYVNIINTSAVTAITLLSVLFFKDKLTIRKLLGVLGVTFGLAILFIA